MTTDPDTPSLEGLTVLDSNKEVVALSTLYQEKPVVLAFVRHFG